MNLPFVAPTLEQKEKQKCTQRSLPQRGPRKGRRGHGRGAVKSLTGHKAPFSHPNRVCALCTSCVLAAGPFVSDKGAGWGLSSSPWVLKASCVTHPPDALDDKSKCSSKSTKACGTTALSLLIKGEWIWEGLRQERVRMCPKQEREINL